MRKTPLFLLWVLLSVNSFADIITQNVQNGCHNDNLMPVNNKTTISALWKLNSYTCAPGYFLPANAIECVKCSSDHTCPGGTYTFNENISQGIMFNSILTTDFAGGCVNDYLWPNANQSRKEAFWQRNSYDCSAGYYLPADGIECAKCLNDNYCLGGTYTFNETNNQGLTPCPAAHPYAPIGMWNELQCGRKLHVGNDVMYLHQSPANPTLHRLFVSFDNKVYSANMVEKQVGIDDPKMSVGVDHAMHVRFNGVEYLVHDDSIE